MSSKQAEIEVSDVSFRYPGTDEPTLTDANVQIESGEFVAVLGGNGSGKTTLCKTFNGLVPHFFEGGFEGTVTVDGTDTRSSSVAELSTTVGYVFQEFENQLVTPTVFEELTFGPLNYGHEAYRERGHQLLDELDIDGVDDRFIWELSGGQKHLVALGGALAMEPSVLVVDEPAAQLDPAHAERAYERLHRLNRQQGMTIVAIEHHTEFVAEYCDSVVLVADGSVEWKLPTDEALNRLEDLRAQRIHPPQVTRVAESVFDDGPYPTSYADGRSRFRSVRTADGTTDDRSPADAERTGDPVVSFRDVTHGYSTLRDGDIRVLDGLSLDLYAGERVALVGSNGAGKSTLLRLLTALERPRSGRVLVDGTDTSDARPEDLSTDVTFVDQNPEEMFIRDTVRSDIAYYLREHGDERAPERVDEIVSFLDLEELQHRDGRLLSVGEQRRATLGIGLATDASILLLDEPTGSLDLASRREVGRTIDRADDRVETTVVATHDLELVAEWATRVVVLDDGAVRTHGPPRDVLGNLALLEACNLRPPQVVRLSRALDLSEPALTVDELADRLSSTSATEPTEASR